MVYRILVLFVLLAVSGCSVFMALDESEAPPDLDTVRVGATRWQVESVLERPLNELRTLEGDKVTYQFIVNDTVGYGRAAAYLAADILTGGLAELITFPIESVQGDRHVLVVTYSPRGIVTAVEHQVHLAPLPDPEEVVGIKEEGESEELTIISESKGTRAPAAEPTPYVPRDVAVAEGLGG